MINKSYVQNVTKLIYCALAFFRAESDTEEKDDLKRVVAVCLAIMLALLLLPGDALAAATYSGSIDDSYSVMLVDQDSGAVLYEQNADAQIAPASTTKIMTCILAIENCTSLDDVVTVDAAGDWSNATGDYSLLHTLRGEKIVLVYGLRFIRLGYLERKIIPGLIAFEVGKVVVQMPVEGTADLIDLVNQGRVPFLKLIVQL
jgi:hypothetical protein